MKHMVPDMHTHTPLCHHAQGAPEEYVAAAVRAGLPEISFTDHAPDPGGYDAEFRMDLADFPEYQRMITGLKAPPGFSILFGIEADFHERTAAFLKTWLPQAPFDIVLGSVHYLGDWGFDNPVNMEQWDKVDVAQTWAHYFRSITAMADSRLFDVAAHLDLPKIFRFRPDDRRLKELALPALDRLAAAGMAIEISTAGLRKLVGEIYPSLPLLGWACERGIPVCFSSDAHKPEQVGFAFDQAIGLARKAGYCEYVRYRGRKATRHPLPVIP
jgi:histidinol-phosphatase (PHP family)